MKRHIDMKPLQDKFGIPQQFIGIIVALESRTGDQHMVPSNPDARPSRLITPSRSLWGAGLDYMGSYRNVEQTFARASRPLRCRSLGTHPKLRRMLSRDCGTLGSNTERHCSALHLSREAVVLVSLCHAGASPFDRPRLSQNGLNGHKLSFQNLSWPTWSRWEVPPLT